MSASTVTVIEINENDLTSFLEGEKVRVHLEDKDGAGSTLWFDEAAIDFDDGEIRALRGPGSDFWFIHPTTGEIVLATVRVR